MGKTELAKALSLALDAPLIRLQCYEGLGEEKALYEWNYAKQLLHIQADRHKRWDELSADVFSEAYLLERPLLRSIRSKRRAVLLVDELDRVDEEFEAFLLELLSDFQITIPELGTIAALHKPVVVLTSNATRELGEALRRRCLYLHMDFPSPERKRRRIDQPCLFVLADVSQSVRAFVRFFLMLTRAFQVTVGPCRSFVFSDGLSEITES